MSVKIAVITLTILNFPFSGGSARATVSGADARVAIRRETRLSSASLQLATPLPAGHVIFNIFVRGKV